MSSFNYILVSYA